MAVCTLAGGSIMYKNILTITIIGLFLISTSMTEAAKPPKAAKEQNPRGTDVYPSGTNSIDVEIGDGYGYNEEIINRSFAFHPDSLNNWYQVYLGFFGVTFGDDSGEVHQSRYISSGIHADGELAVLDTMGTETGIELFGSDTLTSVSGKMGDNTMALENGDIIYFVIGYPITVGTISIEIEQKLLLRENEDDQFLFLEYRLTNLDSVFLAVNDTIFGYFDTLITRPLLNGKAIFFADIDAGDGAEDNFTGIDSSRNLIYQYAEGESYCGFAPLLPDENPIFGNYDNWYDYGTEAKIDTLVSSPDYIASRENVPGDYSSYLVTELHNLTPIYAPEYNDNPHAPIAPIFDGPELVTAAYVFALGHDLQDLQNQIDQARSIYFNLPAFDEISPVSYPDDYELLSVHPNPFNSTASITLALNNTARGSVKIFDPLGRETKTLHSGYLSRGIHDFKWNGDTNAGSGAAAGIYFVRAKYSEFEETKKLIYLP